MKKTILLFSALLTFGNLSAQELILIKKEKCRIL